MEEMDEDSKEEFQDDAKVQSGKRMLSTEDPDYTRPPDPKRMKEMEERAQDELRERVVNVADRVLNRAVSEKQAELEEIDSRILRIQQCLHTLRYCVSLNYHSSAGKAGSNAGISQQNFEAHPAVRRHMGKAPSGRSSSASKKADAEKPSTSFSSVRSLENIKCEPEEGIPKEAMSILGQPTAPEEKLSLEGSSQSTIKISDNLNESSRPPSPKYLPPKPPDSETIVQGRHQKFQTKRRIIVGNTYQYLAPQQGHDVDAMRYKWHIYVRSPSQESDIGSFVSEVTFILDKSYAPHDVISIKHPPFVLSRRGWGEFKVQIILKFIDGRNKQVQLLHPLVLSRPDDPLSLTGLWRLGRESWYDVWVYTNDGKEDATSIAGELFLEEKESPATLEKELKVGQISSRIDENVTISHNLDIVTKKPVCGSKMPKEESERILSEKSNPVRINSSGVFSNASGTIKVTVSEKNVINKESQVKADDSDKVNKSSLLHSVSGDDKSLLPKVVGGDKVIKVKEESTSPSKISVVNGAQNEMCKIHVRQPDGRLVPYFIPAHMYSVALKIAQMRSNSSNASKTETDKQSAKSNDVPKASSSQPENAVINVSKEGAGCSAKVIKLTSASETCTKGVEDSAVATSGVSLTKESRHITTENSPLSSESVANVKNIVNIKDGKQSDNQCIPIRILNLSPSKNQTKVNPVVSAGSSVIGVSKSGVLSQGGKQTILKSTALSQNALLQLLSKVGMKDNSVAVQQLLSNAGLKEGTVDIASLQKVQGQLISSQTAQGAKCNVHLMPLKVVQDKLKSKLPDGKVTNFTSAKIISQPIRPATIKLPVASSDKQIISSGTLPKGLVLNTAVRPNTVLKTPSVNTTILSLGDSKVTQAKILNDKSNIFMLPDGRIVKGSAKRLQVVSSQGNIVPQVNPIIVGNSIEKGKVVQISPLVVGNVGSNKVEIKTSVPSTSAMATTKTAVLNAKGELKTVKLLSTSNLVSSLASSGKTLVKSQLETSTSKLTMAPFLLNASGKVTSILPVKREDGTPEATKSSKSVQLSVLNNSSSKGDEVNAQQLWNKRTSDLVAVCKNCHSVEACLSLWVRAHPLMSDPTSDPCHWLFPYRARSWSHFLEWPLGKQIAAEFQRARDVRYWLDRCQVDIQRQYSVRRIVHWARRKGYIPIASRQKIFSYNISTKEYSNNKEDSTLTYIDELEDDSKEVDVRLLASKDSSLPDVDVVTIDDDSPGKMEKNAASPLKNQHEVVPLTCPDRIQGCEWVGQQTSELRINLGMEEVLPGIMADAGRAVMWQAVRSLMEDLLRSSYSEAWEKSEEEEGASIPSIVPPKSIHFDHVRNALISARPEFDLFSSDGLGTIPKESEDLQ